LADLLHELGDLPASRIRMNPRPKTATEKDVIALQKREGGLFELVDGTLVEKPMGMHESIVAAVLSHFLMSFVLPRKLGLIAGPDGMFRLTKGLVRMPDVSFVSWDQFPGGKISKEPIANLAPKLAAEVISKSNTRAEIKRKLREYFKAGVLLAWIVDPRKRTVAVHTRPTKPTMLKETETLDGGDVLPGFQLPLRELFAILDEEAPN